MGLGGRSELIDPKKKQASMVILSLLETDLFLYLLHLLFCSERNRRKTGPHFPIHFFAFRLIRKGFIMCTICA